MKFFLFAVVLTLFFLQTLAAPITDTEDVRPLSTLINPGLKY